MRMQSVIPHRAIVLSGSGEELLLWQGTASGRAALVAPLIAALPQNIATACEFLEAFDLADVAMAFRAENGEAK